MIKKEPRMEISDLLGLFLIYMGLLFPLVLLNILRINTVGFTKATIFTIFTIYMWTYIGAFIMGLTAATIHLLRWITYQATTAKWLKIKNKKGGL